MRIIIDGDGCPVRKEAVKIAKQMKLEAIIVVDIHHLIQDDYAKVVTVDKGFDAVDFRIVSLLSQGDLVITQDYGLASLVLSKASYAMDQNGMIYDTENIDRLLFQRHMSKKVRKAGGRTKGPAKRKKEDTQRFEENLKKFLEENM